MIAIARPVPSKTSRPVWHAGFLAMLPAIERHAKIAFRHLDAEAREEMVQEVICNACRAYARLAELNKTEVAYPGALARFGVAQARSGRRTGGKRNCRDVLNGYCQMKKDLVVERLDHRDDENDGWSEILVEDKHAGPAEIAACRIDFATWLRSLPRRLRRIATFLANGETTSAAALRFQISQARISQLRRELFSAWQCFQGNLLAMTVA